MCLILSLLILNRILVDIVVGAFGCWRGFFGGGVWEGKGG